MSGLESHSVCSPSLVGTVYNKGHYSIGIPQTIFHPESRQTLIAYKCTFHTHFELTSPIACSISLI